MTTFQSREWVIDKRSLNCPQELFPTKEINTKNIEITPSLRTGTISRGTQDIKDVHNQTNNKRK